MNDWKQSDFVDERRDLTARTEKVVFMGRMMGKNREMRVLLFGYLNF